jgi:hypothetical protein
MKSACKTCESKCAHAGTKNPFMSGANSCVSHSKNSQAKKAKDEIIDRWFNGWKVPFVLNVGAAERAKRLKRAIWRALDEQLENTSNTSHGQWDHFDMLKTDPEERRRLLYGNWNVGSTYDDE